MEYLIRIHQVVTQSQFDELQKIGLLPFKSVKTEQISIEDIDRLIKDVINENLEVEDEIYTRADRKSATATAKFFRAAYLYKYTNLTLVDCAKVCEYNDHTSVIYSRKQVDELSTLGRTISSYKKYALLADALDNQLKSKIIKQDEL